MSVTPEAQTSIKSISIVGWLQHHRRSLLFLVFMLTVVGIVAAMRLPVTLFPRVDFPRVVVDMDAGDRPVEQMAQDVTMPTENAIRSVPNVGNVRSTTTRGSAEISVNFDWHTDMSTATSQINQAIAQLLPQLPAGTQMTVKRMDPTVFPILAYSLRSNSLNLSELRLLAERQLRPLLSTVNGVSRVEVVGGTQDEYQVIADPDRLQALGLTLSDLSTALTAANVISADGRLEDQYKLYLVITNSPLHDETDIGNVVVKTGTDGIILLKDVATISKHPAPQVARVTADGQDAVLINIYQQPAGNSIQIAKDIDTEVALAHLPATVRMTSWYDQSQLVSASARSVMDAIVIGMGLAGLVLLLFLRNFKITVIAVLMVPVVLALTTILLSLLNMSFNIMTLGGMAAAVGLIIDDAIVMVEHLIRRLHEHAQDQAEGQFSKHAVRAGIMASAQEFLRPLAGSSASTIVIFVPLAFLTGVTGAFFKALSLTMATGLLISFLMTWLVVPILANLFLTDQDVRPHKPSRLAVRLSERYAQILGRLLRTPILALIIVLPLLALGGWALYQVGSGFMPALDEGGFVLDYHTPAGTSLTETDRLLRQVETIIQKNPNVLTYSRRTGLGLGGGLNESNQGDFFIRLKPEPREPIDVVMAEVRSQVEQQVPGVEIELAQLMEDMIGDLTAVPQPIEVKIYADDPAVLNQLASKTATAIGQVQGVVDIDPGIMPAGDAIEVHVDPARAALAGLSTDAINQMVQDAMTGRVVTRISQANALSVGTLAVRVWIPAEQRQTILDLQNLPLRTAAGTVIRLQDVAELVTVAGQAQINREQMQRMVAVTARISGRDLGSAVSAVQAVVTAKGFLPAGVRVEMGGLYAQQQIAFHGLMMVFVTAVALVFLLLLFLYERFVVALSVLLMPLLAASSVFIGLWVTGIELNISAMMGMTMIIGIVTEVAIFYFSEYFELRQRDLAVATASEAAEQRYLTLHQLLILAGQNRMRPIAMTTIAAILTLLPLAFALGEGSAMQQPLAIAIIAGLAVQLPLVLLVMPVLFNVLFNLAHRLARQS